MAGGEWIAMAKGKKDAIPYRILLTPMGVSLIYRIKIRCPQKSAPDRVLLTKIDAEASGETYYAGAKIKSVRKPFMRRSASFSLCLNWAN